MPQSYSIRLMSAEFDSLNSPPPNGFSLISIPYVNTPAYIFESGKSLKVNAREEILRNFGSCLLDMRRGTGRVPDFDITLKF